MNVFNFYLEDDWRTTVGGLQYSNFARSRLKLNFNNIYEIDGCRVDQEDCGKAWQSDKHFFLNIRHK